MPVFVAGLSHRTSPVELRECFAFADDQIAPALAQLRSTGLVLEGVILSTCNRVELYVASDHPEAELLPALRGFLTEHGRSPKPLGPEIYTCTEPQSIEHLFRVAAGLDSMVLGETEILGQLKKAYDIALKNGCTGRFLNRVFQRAFNVAKQIRTETQIQRGSVSVASVAVDLAEKVFDTLAERAVMVLGAGDTSEKAAKALLGRGASPVLVANRTHERAEALASALGGQAVPFESWMSALDPVDILVSSTSAPDHLLDTHQLEPVMKRRRYRPLLLIDLAVPRDIDPGVETLENVYLYNVDHLQAIADDAMNQRREQIARCETLIHQRAISVLSTPHRRPLLAAQPETAESPSR
jgi:glutamyl-tRNA reductase